MRGLEPGTGNLKAASGSMYGVRGLTRNTWLVVIDRFLIGACHVHKRKAASALA